MAEADLTVARLREMFSYDPSTGILVWKQRPRDHFATARAHAAWNSRFPGLATGWRDKKGYLRTNIMGTPHLTHRLCWAVHFGVMPDLLDHRNLDKSDNRIGNLRECTSSQNQHNRAMSKHNSSGFKNVSWHAQAKKWRAYIVVDHRQSSLGLFATPEAAYAAYCAAAVDLHGDFANTGSVPVGCSA